MSPFKILIDLGLMCWSVIFLGFRKGWVKRKDVFEYAVSLLVSGNESEDVAVIAGGEYLSDDELLSLVSKQIEKSDYVADLDKWRLAFLLCIDGSDDCEQDKINRLQEVYADFGYPEDMVSCSVYSQDDVCPLVAMKQVVKELQGKFLLR
ncbi:DUF2247 family protein [Pseudomonas sp. UBA2684]|uniref:DUF2247 family protein n=1 Tax=Pseudomonas sp. UBA2684 TaxID=1947311 RepID=UPI000E96D18A|nr:DUF2247 family protein [Pseudomonas sp. UBA2684]HBX57751.1 DUF2247 domain-containing protein [Pseudomonas sp.]|tara:strand:+ start:756 stop:1205 length:450 start_codon:yes stop_codon:yes gene_type:complete